MIKYRNRTSLYDDLEDDLMDDEEEEEEDCPQYGKGWERDHDDCIRCPDEKACKREFLRSRRLVQPIKKPRRQNPINQSIVRHRERDPVDARMPREGEHWGERVMKNSAAGALSAIGREFMIFWDNFRW